MVIADQPPAQHAAPKQKRANRSIALAAAGFVACMVGAAYAAVPLYDLFCRVTGYGGTTQRVATGSATVGDRVVAIRFNADVSSALPWRFQPEQLEMSVKVGESGLAYYRATNLSDAPIVGTASYNVTPQKAGLYFNKIECFCFTEQTLAPGETVDMPVQFFVDPSIGEDPNLDDLTTITLSYMFFPADSGDDDAATETTAAAGAGSE